MTLTGFSYEEAFEKSLKYFEGNDLAAKVFLDKYALRDNEGNILEDTPEKMHWRIAAEFARIEALKFKKPMTKEEIFSYLDKFGYIVPQGSPMYGIGNNYQTVSLSNCYVTESPLDSYSGILKIDQEMAQISKRRGGVGTDLSNLRPDGAVTQNAARTSTGIIPFMERYSNTIREVGQSGRRGALMLSISVHHPQVLDFATVKNDETKVTGANVSIRLTDEFLMAVKNDEEYEQRWPVDSKTPKISNMVRAREVWETVVHSAWLRAEPGLLFWDNIQNNNAVDCYKDFGFETISTNPCSELPLCAYDSCRLLVQNLFSYVINPFKYNAYFDFELFSKHAKISQRLMDDMIDLELENLNKIIAKIKKDPEDAETKRPELKLWEKIKKKCEEGRRTGTGITAEADMLAALGLKYGSNRSIEVVEEVHKVQKLASFSSSVEMSKELGPFPIWCWNIEKNSSFLRKIEEEDPKLYKDMAKYGRRNIANLTIAPTGSLSILTQTTSGIEPLFMLEPYTRRKKINPTDEHARTDFVDKSGDHWQEFQVYHPKVKLWMDITGKTELEKAPWYGCCAEDLDWKNRVKLQAAAQKHIDHAISSTLNLPEDVELEKVAEIYQTAWESGCKGVTVYRKNCRTGVLIDNSSKRSENTMIKTDAPKRPRDLPCDIYHMTTMGEKFFVVVGLINGEPYEVFAGKDEMFSHKSAKSGSVKKLKRGHYQVTTDSGNVAIDDTHGLVDPDKESLTRMASTALRHGADISFVVEQLNRNKGGFQSFAKTLARALKKYIADGKSASGQVCQSCNSSENLRYQEGCVTCSCGWSKCG